jgi:hypothetical protein
VTARSGDRPWRSEQARKNRAQNEETRKTVQWRKGMAQIRFVQSGGRKSSRAGNAGAKIARLSAMGRLSHGRLKARLIAIV